MTHYKSWGSRGMHGGLLAVALVWSAPAWAIASISAGNFSQFNQADVDGILRTVGIGTIHRAYQPASALGLVIGLDVGIELTAIRVPSDVIATIKKGSSGNQGPPALLPLPRLNVHKGLPFNLDVGFSFVSLGSDARLVGGDVKWTAPIKPPLTQLAARLSYSNNHLWYVDTNAVGFDFLASQSLVVIEPYLGAGVQFWSGKLTNLPTGSSALLGGVSSEASGSNFHVFAGLPINLALIKTTLEYDYSFAAISSFGLKVSFAF